MEGGGCTPWQSLCDDFLCMGLGLWVITGMGWLRTLYNQHLYTLWKHYVLPAWRLASSSCFSWKKRLHSHTQLVRPQQVN